MFIPRGFAHGFVTTSNEAIISYKVDNYYNCKSERGINYNDKFLNIDWKLPHDSIILSKKDKNNCHFKDSEFFDFSHNLYA